MEVDNHGNQVAVILILCLYIAIPKNCFSVFVLVPTFVNSTFLCSVSR
jgi:hypothetical protein